jgi:hypothetical protein
MQFIKKEIWLVFIHNVRFLRYAPI